MVLTSGESGCSAETIDLSRPTMLTSSSLGDDLVDAPRRLLFDTMFANNRDWLAAQRQFHAHQWTSRPDISIRMERPDARTVSRTTIDVGSQRIAVDYESLGSSPSTVVLAA